MSLIELKKQRNMLISLAETEKALGNDQESIKLLLLAKETSNQIIKRLTGA
jgi:hypothetical protein